MMLEEVVLALCLLLLLVLVWVWVLGMAWGEHQAKKHLGPRLVSEGYFWQGRHPSLHVERLRRLLLCLRACQHLNLICRKTQDLKIDINIDKFVLDKKNYQISLPLAAL